VIRKRQQIDQINELPKEKRPPDDYIWGDGKELDKWFDAMFNTKKPKGKNEGNIDIFRDIPEG
jgi:hypothetical protein